MSIYVTKPFLPPLEEYTANLKKIWDCQQLTNQGPCLIEFEEGMKKQIEAEYFHFLANGTLALQLALRALDISGEVILTPFTYVATLSSILWEGCEPVFVDINYDSLCIDPAKIEAAITPKTKAIMAVHIFGYACDVEAIERIAKKHNLKVIYDGAHALSTRYKNRPLLTYGDIATISFHATKQFHTVEGGGCVIKDKSVSDKLDILKRFGHIGDEHFILGINAKNSEFHAAMGLTLFPYLSEIMAARQHICEMYDKYLADSVKRPIPIKDLEHNYAYYPVIFKSEAELLQVFDKLKQNDIYPRRYFYPSLNTLPYVKNTPCPVSEDISRRIACLPLFPGLQDEDVIKICSLILSVTGSRAH